MPAQVVRGDSGSIDSGRYDGLKFCAEHRTRWSSGSSMPTLSYKTQILRHTATHVCSCHCARKVGGAVIIPCFADVAFARFAGSSKVPLHWQSGVSKGCTSGYAENKSVFSFGWVGVPSI